jgi:hypothetical protein
MFVPIWAGTTENSRCTIGKNEGHYFCREKREALRCEQGCSNGKVKVWSK